MKTKQEVINFLESKVGGGVKCIGNPSLDSQCVTLIKSLMEFLAIPDPYKARGNAKDCISNYIKQGIAKPGLGTLSVYSNKDMGDGAGHIWCSIDEIFYESNGVKPLKVTKGKTYSYDNVCNFDKNIKEVDTSDTEQLKADLAAKEATLKDLTRQRDELVTQLNESKSSSDGFRKQYNNFIAECAKRLDTRQEEVEVLSAIDTCITYEDKALELDRQLEVERKEHQADVESFGKEIKSLKDQLASLENKYKELKDTQITPVKPIANFSIIELVKKILGG